MDASLAKEWSPRVEQLLQSKHLKQQAKRAYKIHKIVRGSKDCLPWKEFHREVASLVGVVEITGVESTANNGGIVVQRGPMEGYSILVHAADVYVMHLADLADDRKAMWDRARELWNRKAPA